MQDALQELVWTPFEHETGCTIEVVGIDRFALESAIEAGAPGIDLLLADGVWAAELEAAELLQPLPDLPVESANTVAFPSTAATIPAYAYALVIAYATGPGAGRSLPATWQDVWAEDRVESGLSLPRFPLGTAEAAALAAGIQPDHLYPLDTAVIQRQVAAVREAVADRWWTAGDEPLRWLLSGEVTVAAAWHHRVVAARRDGRPVDFTWEQSVLMHDVWAMPAESPNTDIATQLLVATLAPEPQAAFARRTGLASLQTGAIPLLAERDLVFLPIWPATLDRVVLYDPEWWSTYAPAMEAALDCWIDDLGCPVPPFETGAQDA